MDSQSDSRFQVHPVPDIRMASLPRDGSHINEDLAVVFGKAAWVLDGASDPLPRAGGCSHNALWYVRALSSALTVSIGQQPDAPLSDLLATAIEATRVGHDRLCNHGEHLRPSAAVALVRWSADTLEYLVLGDCCILHRQSDDLAAFTDTRLENVAISVRAEILERLRQRYGFNDPERPKLLSQLVEAEQRSRNTHDGYWIAAYQTDAAEHAVTGSLQLHSSQTGSTTVALLTDGLGRASRIFRIYESYARFLDELQGAGPRSCARAVRSAERADASGRRYPRTKPSDDASGIVLSWD